MKYIKDSSMTLMFAVGLMVLGISYVHAEGNKSVDFTGYLSLATNSESQLIDSASLPYANIPDYDASVDHTGYFSLAFGYEHLFDDFTGYLSLATNSENQLIDSANLPYASIPGYDVSVDHTGYLSLALGYGNLFDDVTGYISLSKGDVDKWQGTVSIDDYNYDVSKDHTGYMSMSTDDMK